MSYVFHPGVFQKNAGSAGGPTAFFTGVEPGVDVSALVPHPVWFPVQKHTSQVARLDKIDAPPVVADAVITQRDDVVLGVKVADCVPILVYDPRQRAGGAVHAGWRGTAAGILKKTVAAMADEFGSRPGDLLVALGPAIRWCCYEVGADVLDAVKKATGPGEYFKPGKGGKSCLDLQSANRLQALSSGVPARNMEVVEECTYCYQEKFGSYRRTGSGAGRQGGFIGTFTNS